MFNSHPAACSPRVRPRCFPTLANADRIPSSNAWVHLQARPSEIDVDFTCRGKLVFHRPFSNSLKTSLSTVEDGRPVFSFSLAPLDEIFRTEKRHVSRLEFCVSSSIRRFIDRQVRRCQRGLDTKRAAGGDPVGYVDSNFEGCVLVGQQPPERRPSYTPFARPNDPR